MNYLDFFKKGGKSGIHIKKKNRGKFTDYCGGAVTEECIQRGKHSSNPTTRKRANFAWVARHKFKHQSGGELIVQKGKESYSRAQVKDKSKSYTEYLPETNSTYSRESTYVTANREPYKENYDLSGYNIPSLTITSGESKSDNKLHTDITGLLDLFNKYNIRVRVTSGYREGATTSNGSQSHHATGHAIDVVPVDGNFAKLAIAIKTNPEIRNYMMSKGLGVLDETTKEMLARTGGTGAHYHIGPDKIAQKFWLT